LDLWERGATAVASAWGSVPIDSAFQAVFERAHGSVPHWVLLVRTGDRQGG